MTKSQTSPSVVSSSFIGVWDFVIPCGVNLERLLVAGDGGGMALRSTATMEREGQRLHEKPRSVYSSVAQKPAL